MKKRTRNPSPKQRDKLAVETAKILKRKGVLSKQTKLHGGRYVSRSVLKKVEEFRHLAYNRHGEAPSYIALKVPKAYAKKAREEGYQVVQGNRVIVPREHDFIKRVKSELKRGIEAAPSGVRPVKGGFMSEITLPFTPTSTTELMDWLQHGDLEDYKLPHEMFAFSFHGSTSFRGFFSAKQMREYLEHYNQDQMLKALKIFRLHPDDQPIHFGRTRISVKTGPRGRQNNRGDYVSYSKKNPVREKARNAAKYKARLERLAQDPGKREAYLQRSRDRALAHYHANKKNK